MQFVKLNGKEIIPSKIVYVGRNYVEHIEELNNNVISVLIYTDT